MVNKLFKHEIAYYLKRLLPFYIILTSVAFFSRVLQIFEIDSFIYDIILGSSTVTYVVMNIAVLAAVTINAVVRYYKNLFTREGYLSFTLPVTAAQHILVKLSTAILFLFITLIDMIISFAIFTAGEVFSEVIKAVDYLYNSYSTALGAHGVFYIIEVIVLFLVYCVFGLLVYYTCITIGQLAKKNRIASAFGVYLIFYLIEQAIGTLFVILISAFSMSERWIAFTEYIVENIYTFVHIGFIGTAVIFAVLSLVLYLIDSHIIIKKFNLE
ncbi:MAG: hypothetical protein U0M42_04300 [Acutalibacteraceae bacterium]|nr:hypothetical protein [Acutalibacteraceae bacterium]